MNKVVSVLKYFYGTKDLLIETVEDTTKLPLYLGTPLYSVLIPTIASSCFAYTEVKSDRMSTKAKRTSDMMWNIPGLC